MKQTRTFALSWDFVAKAKTTSGILGYCRYCNSGDYLGGTSRCNLTKCHLLSLLLSCRCGPFLSMPDFLPLIVLCYILRTSRAPSPKSVMDERANISSEESSSLYSFLLTFNPKYSNILKELPTSRKQQYNFKVLESNGTKMLCNPTTKFWGRVMVSCRESSTGWVRPPRSPNLRIVSVAPERGFATFQDQGVAVMIPFQR